MSVVINPLVSVRFMVYNNERYVRKAIEGILEQKTNFRVEVVVGDDFSTDNTLEIIKSYSDTEKIKIVVLNRPVGGEYWKKRKSKTASVRTNFVDIVENCQGKYIALLDGDDYWTDPLKLQKQVDFLEANSAYKACFHYTQTIKENGELGRMFGQNDDKMDYDAESTFTSLALCHTSSFVFLRSALKIPDWFFKVTSGDMALFSIIAAKGNLRCLPEVMSVYRKNEGSITNTPNLLNNFHAQRITLIKYLNEFHDYKYSSVADELIASHEMAISQAAEKRKNQDRNSLSLFKKVVLAVKSIFSS